MLVFYEWEGKDPHNSMLNVRLFNKLTCARIYSFPVEMIQYLGTFITENEARTQIADFNLAVGLYF